MNEHTEKNTYMCVVSYAYRNDEKDVWEVHTEYHDSNHPRAIAINHIVTANDTRALALAVEEALGLNPYLRPGEWLEENS